MIHLFLLELSKGDMYRVGVEGELDLIKEYFHSLSLPPNKTIGNDIRFIKSLPQRGRKDKGKRQIPQVGEIVKCKFVYNKFNLMGVRG